jgi:hypothetical protein
MKAFIKNIFSQMALIVFLLPLFGCAEDPGQSSSPAVTALCDRAASATYLGLRGTVDINIESRGVVTFYAVCDRTDLITVASSTSSALLKQKFALMNDIDLTSYFTGGGAAFSIGSETVPFTGEFHGNAKTITGFKNSKGLFDTLSAAYVHNLSLANSVILSATSITGALARKAVNDTEISGVIITGADVRGTQQVGGVVGYLSDSYITFTKFSGSVLGTTFSVGGLAGEVALNVQLVTAPISYSKAAGTVTGDTIVGGLVGEGNAQFESATTLISNSYSATNVSARTILGGVLGRGTKSRISLSYATGAIAASFSKAGGLLGEATDTVEIQDSFSSATVSGGSSAVIAGNCNGQLKFVAGASAVFRLGSGTNCGTGALAAGSNAVSTFAAPSEMYVSGHPIVNSTSWTFTGSALPDLNF